MLTQAWHKTHAAFRGLYDDFQQFLAPSSCLCCGRARDFEDRLLCPACIQALQTMNPGVGPACPFCGNLLTDPQCHSCAAPGALRLYYWGVYDCELKECILQFKFHGARELGPRLVQLSCESPLKCFPLDKYDLVMPVPLHRRRRRQRQFNQSELLAAELSKFWQTNFSAEYLVRAKSTFQQAKLPENERWSNVKDAFLVPAKFETRIAGKNILLVDDIVTTGATVYEASRPLLAAGAAGVDIFSLARAL